MKKIGITTTVPVEVLIAAGYQPIDLNNVLVSDPNPGRLITIAERAGFPLNCCSWIKGIYGVCMDCGIGDIIFRDAIDLPMLTLEGNDDFFLNSHIKTRVEAFLDMLQRSRSTFEKIRHGKLEGANALSEYIPPSLSPAKEFIRRAGQK